MTMAQTLQWLIVAVIVALAARQVLRQVMPARARMPRGTITIHAVGSPTAGSCSSCNGCGGCPTRR
jgi:hypothetical protein